MVARHTYHVAVSIRYARQVLDSMEQEGREVIPPCENVDRAGRCRGHQVKEGE